MGKSKRKSLRSTKARQDKALEATSLGLETKSGLRPNSPKQYSLYISRKLLTK
jgi:hypothetical protein